MLTSGLPLYDTVRVPASHRPLCAQTSPSRPHRGAWPPLAQPRSSPTRRPGRAPSQFLANMWEHRSRVFPLRRPSVEGMEQVAALGAPVDLVYIDADHTFEAALADLRAAHRCFPHALLSGDDWQWQGVRRAVEQFACERGDMHVHAHDKENWWWLERRAGPLPHGPRGGAVEFVPASDTGAR